MKVPSNYLPLAGSERTALPAAQLVGAADPNEQAQVTVYVRPKSELNAAAANQPHLTREQFRQAHAASDADLDRVRDFAKSNHLRVIEVNDLHRSVKLAGTVDQLSRAFAVELHRYDSPSGGYRGRTGAVHIPQALNGIVVAVLGLDDRPAAEPRCGRHAPAAIRGKRGSASLAADGVGPAVGGTFTAPQLAQLYNFPANRNGAGETIAIIELGGGINTADLAPYFTNLGLTVPPIAVVSVDGGQNIPDQNDGNATLEVMLDIEVAGAVAPGARLAVYFAPNTDQSFINAVNSAVHDNINTPSIISISWGKSENSWTASFRTLMDQAFQAAGLLGISVYCASADNGSRDRVTDGRAHADFPSSSPNAIGCGGTSLTAVGTTISAEVVWNNGTGQISGGGISDSFAVPPYQSGISMPPSVNPGSGPGRGVPDVSGHAASYAIQFFGGQISAFGTSAVAPLWAGLTARLNQSLGRRLGFLSPMLYRNIAAFRDIGSGNNGDYIASTGWDPCTGLGSPNGNALLAVARPAPTQRGNRNFLQSNYGGMGNFELLVPHGDIVKQYFRDNDDPAFPWHFVRDFGYAGHGPVGPKPRFVTFLQSNFSGDGAHGNFEAVVRVGPPVPNPVQPDHLDFWFLDSKTNSWNGPFPLAADGQAIDGVTGNPAFIQSTFGARGNFELLVPHGHVVRHYFRDNDTSALPWHVAREFGYKTQAGGLGQKPRSVTLLQSNFRGDGIHGNFEVIVRVAPALPTQKDHLDFWFFDSKTLSWNGPQPITADGKAIDGVTGDPVLIQSDFGAQGNLELLVPQGNVIRQYFRDDDDPAFSWHFLRELSYPPSVHHERPNPRSVTFFQSNFRGDGVHGNFEAVVRVAAATPAETDRLDFWFQDSRSDTWNGPLTISAGGQPVDHVTGD